eukprot:8683656-Prorocentrum_lima.AAC.1
MTSSLVGSEMCIRDSKSNEHRVSLPRWLPVAYAGKVMSLMQASVTTCLLYTSDAADECRSRWS